MSKKFMSPKLPTINLALAGMQGSGKTAILVKFFTDRYIAEYSSSIVDTIQKAEVVDGQSYIINLRDSNDTDENYIQSTFNWADILLVVYSITSRCSYYRAMEIFRMYSQFNKQKKSIAILVANKSDLADLRLVQNEEGHKAANMFNSTYIECSVIDNLTIKHLFQQSTRLYIQHISNHSISCTGSPNQLQNSSKSPPLKSSNSSITSPKILPKTSNNKSNDTGQKKNSVAFRLFSKKSK